MLARLFGNLSIDVADGNNIAPRQGTVGDHRTLITHADRSDPKAIVL
jgi:hypothetical protein